MHDETTQFTLFVSDLVEAQELRETIELAGYQPYVVVCAQDEDTPYLRSALVKIAGHGNIRRFLASGTRTPH
ncbi:MAG: hypothetical protein F4Z48_05895 [Dehalococcoidia bacterium]|nr:hypothetical protein [Dehalococcoidia bacterium]